MKPFVLVVTMPLLLATCVLGKPFHNDADYDSMSGSLDRQRLQLLGSKFTEMYRRGEIQLSQPSLIYQQTNYVHPDRFPANSLMGTSDAHFTQTSSEKWYHFNWKSVPCEICKLMVGVVQDAFIVNATEEAIVKELTNVCIDLQIEDQRVCSSIVPLFKSEVLTVIDSLVLDPTEICGYSFGEDCGDTYNPYNMWYIELPSTPKPPVKPLTPPKPGSPTIRILQLSDIHVDLRYKAGANANCGEPLCCRANNGPPVEDPAGRWGDYRNCDTPPWTLENMFQEITKNHTFDYVYWTGDLPAHNVWNQSRSDQVGMVQYLTGLFDKYMPGAIILPSIGNHESSPVDSFPPPFIQGKDSITWLYQAIKANWIGHLPKNGSYQYLDTGAYYTVLLRPGFRVVSINTNYCNTNNWWVLINSTDPAQELQWLVGVLQAAEDAGEKVHILGHIPTGSSCNKAWSWNYYMIVNRYESTITGQFFGHTHRDHFELYYDTLTLKRPVSVAYMGPSVTTYGNLNPGFRFYTVDGFYKNSSFSVLDHETYIMNITEANVTGKPRWFKEYSAKAAYNMTSLFPADWNQLVERMKTNTTLFDTWYRYYTKLVPYGPCDDSCRNGLLCDLRTARTHDDQLCKDLVPDIHVHLAMRQRTNPC